MSLSSTADPPAVSIDLDASTDEQLVANASDGREHALAELLSRYRPFVRLKARSYFLVGADREDVVQEGMIGLYKAVRDYDATRQASFRAFAELCVTRQIITAIKAATRFKHAPLNSYVSLHLPAYHDDEPEHEMVEQIVSPVADPADSVVSASELAAMEDYFGEILSELEADVLTRYVEGQTYSEIATALDRHVKSIDNALQRIKRKIEIYLDDRSAGEPA